MFWCRRRVLKVTHAIISAIKSFAGGWCALKLLGKRRQWFLEKCKDVWALVRCTCTANWAIRLASPTTGCARLQLQASLHCTRWHELCDDESFSFPKECRACEVYSTQVEDGGVLIFFLLVYSGNSLPLRGLPPCPSAFAMRMLRV